MSLPSYYKFWQPNTDLNFDTDIMSGYKKLNSMGLGLGSNKPSLPTKSGLGSVLGIAGGVAGGLMDLYQGLNADTSEIDNAVDRQIDALGNLKYNKADSIDELMANQSAYRGLEANHTADEFYKGPSDGELFTNALAKGASSALSTSSAGPIASAISGGLGFLGSLAGGIFGRKAQRRAASAGASELNTEERRKNAYMDLAFRNDANNINTINNRTLMSQVGISAYGGPLGVSLTPVNGAIDFMQNEELLSSLGEDTTKNNNRRVSMPMFAFGGALGGYGGDWSNGLTYIGAGGSHEENPLGGVPAGMSQDGRPNQVEEGEYIWTDQDYVFSRRIEIPEEEYEALGLKKGKRKLTYADGAEILQKESAERPNDPISERGKNAALIKLMQSQEQQRALLAQQEQQEQIEYAMGGPKNKSSKGKYSVKGSPANKYTALGQVLNSVNPQTAMMNAARDVQEYQDNLNTQAKLNYYAKLGTMPFFMGAGVGMDAMYPALGAVSSSFAPELTDIGKQIIQDYEKPVKDISMSRGRIGIEYADGGGLSRSKDYGSKKKPYPKVKDKDFAGGGRSYPIPTKADAIDALRLAGLHGRSDVKAKVYKKYPELKKALGGHLFDWGGVSSNNPYGNMFYTPSIYKSSDNIPYINTNIFNDATRFSTNNGIFNKDFLPNASVGINYTIPTSTESSISNVGNVGTTNGTYLIPDRWGSELQNMLNKSWNNSVSGRSPYINEFNTLNNSNLTWSQIRDVIANNNYSRQDNSIIDMPSKKLESSLTFPTSLPKEYNFTLAGTPTKQGNTEKGAFDPLPTSGWQTALRYAPVLGSAISLGYNLFNKPDYQYADKLSDLADSYRNQIGHHIMPRYLGDYLAYNPFDRIFYANELGAQQAANRSAIVNTGNANRGATMAALLGSGYNDNVAMGKLFREGDEYNLNQRQKVTEFNRGTNMFNIQNELQAELAGRNNDIDLLKAANETDIRGLAMRQAIDNQRIQGINLALTDLFNNVGGIGEDFVNRYDRNALINADVFGTLSQKPYGVSDADWQDYVNAHKKVFSANGGKLNRKKKKGLTI